MSRPKSIEDLYLKESKFFKYGFLVVSILLIVTSISTYFLYTAKEKRFFKISSSLSKLPSIEAICEEGFRDIVTDNNDSVFLSTGLKNILADSPFIIDPYKIKSIGMKDKNCHVLLLSKRKTYLFKVGFIKDDLIGSVIDSVDQITPKELL